ncbi:Asp-tRNA(Asn)/Glu-tRNA(Gln) amidotransferase subunit GatA [Desulfothermus okinawensis JCM 13304]
MDVRKYSGIEIRNMVLNGEVKVEEVVRAYLNRIDETEGKIDALLHVDRDGAIKTAREMDKKGPDPQKKLWGIPIVVKDVLTTKGIPTTCASKILENFIPFYDSEVVRRIKAEGGIVIAKSNMDEFAMGSSTENSAFKKTKNPWDLKRVPGGSSGGSAAATSACQCPISIGTDTGGSIRQPAAFCGVVGLKPTYGRVSRFGLIAYGSSLDQAGPITRNVKDAALMLSVIAGKDEKDSTSSPNPTLDYLKEMEKIKNLKGIKIGLPKEYWQEGLDIDIQKKSEEFFNLLKELGAQLKDISLPHTKYAVATYYIIVMAEASSNLARYDGVRYGYRAKDAEELIDMYVKTRSEGFGFEVQRRIILGTYVLSAGYYDAYYKKAAQVRRLIRKDFLDAFSDCDLILTPVSPTLPFKLREKIDDPLKMYLADIFTTPLNLSGLPGISMPVGLGDDQKLPVGLQFIGPPFREDLLFGVSNVVEGQLEPLPEPFGLK